MKKKHGKYCLGLLIKCCAAYCMMQCTDLPSPVPQTCVATPEQAGIWMLSIPARHTAGLYLTTPFLKSKQAMKPAIVYWAHTAPARVLNIFYALSPPPLSSPLACFSALCLPRGMQRSDGWGRLASDPKLAQPKAEAAHPSPRNGTPSKKPRATLATVSFSFRTQGEETLGTGFLLQLPQTSLWQDILNVCLN